ncbi:MAG: hypothetical protein DMG37_06175 [Acidobacteria bacterium]|nr:MAG: hypothetical protein DMG37_06175 [Acidobacteriota bacterium]
MDLSVWLPLFPTLPWHQKYHDMRLFAVVPWLAHSSTGPCFIISQFIVSLRDTEIFSAFSRKAFRVSPLSGNSCGYRQVNQAP